MKRTIFQRAKRQVQQTQATGIHMQEVSTENELLSAVSAIASSGVPGTIVIVAPFTISAPVVIPSACAGLTIKAAGKFDIGASGAVSSMFDVRAEQVTIRDIYSFNTAALINSTGNKFRTFVTSTLGQSGTSNSVRPALLNNIVFTARFYVEANTIGVADYGAPSLIDNVCRSPDSESEAMVEIQTSGARLIGNRFVPDSIAFVFDDSLGSGVLGGNAMFVGNSWGGGSVDTSDAAAGSIFSANRDYGTQTLHADDIDLDAREAVALLSATTTVNVSSATAPTSGQVLTATSDTAATWQTPSSGSAWTTITKTATETITSDATLSDDAVLKFPMAANTTYRFRLAVMFETTGGNDFQYQLNGPAAPTKVTVLCTHGAQGAAPATQVVDTSYGNTASGAMAGGTGVGSIRIEGIIENGANAGDLAFQWAAAVVLAQNSSVLKGSYIEYAEVA